MPFQERKNTEDAKSNPDGVSIRLPARFCGGSEHEHWARAGGSRGRLRPSGRRGNESDDAFAFNRSLGTGNR